jgi:hypothetical protein
MSGRWQMDAAVEDSRSFRTPPPGALGGPDRSSELGGIPAGAEGPCEFVMRG